MLIYNNTFKEDIKMLLFFANYGFKAKLTYIMRDVEVVVEKVVVKIY